MKWEVRGLKDGKPGQWRVEAESEEAAHRKASGGGVAVQEVRPFRRERSPAAAAPTADYGISAKGIAALIILPLAAVVIALWVVMRISHPKPPEPARSEPVAIKTTTPTPAPATPPPGSSGLASAVSRIFAPAPVYGSVAGSAWLSRNNGGSDLLRGLHVQLIPQTIPTSAARGTVSADLQRATDTRGMWQKTMDDTRKQEADFYARYGRPLNLSDEIPKTEIAKADREIAAANAFLAAPATELDAARIFEAVSAASSSEESAARAFSARVFDEVTTSADGKYTIKHIATGSWYIYAVLDTETVLVEWLIPIQISSDKEISLDLFNDNATKIRSRK